MPVVTLLTPTAILLDGKPAGTPGEFLAAHPHLASDFAAALQAHYLAKGEADRLAATERAQRAEQAAAELKARYEPASLDVYFLVVELPEALRSETHDHFGLRSMQRGAHWRGDLLRSLGDGQHALAAADGLKVPMDAKVSSLSELDAEHLAADLDAMAEAPAAQPAAST
jgi:hypothetical protein